MPQSNSATATTVIERNLKAPMNHFAKKARHQTKIV